MRTCGRRRKYDKDALKEMAETQDICTDNKNLQNRRHINCARY